MSPKRYCSVQTCGQYAVTNTQKCETHTYRRKQASAHVRGYGSKWRAMRRAFLRESPYCARCPELAEHVDHIIPKSQGGEDSIDNLQGLCSSCHGKKTTLEDGASRNFRR